MKEAKLPFKMICPFCSAEYTPQMEAEIEEGMSVCESCGPDPATGVITILCAKCGRVVYKKEYESYN